METNGNGVESILEIDKLRLDREWVNQPVLYYKYAAALADAKADQEELKAELDVAYAQIAKSIRENPKEYGYEKATDKCVEQTVPLQSEYTSVLRRLNKAKHKVGILLAAVEALDHRKQALESLVYLHNSSYFASPQAPEGSRETMKEVEQRAIIERGRGRHVLDD